MDVADRPFTETFVVGGQTCAGIYDRETSTVHIRCATGSSVQVDDLIVWRSSPLDVQLRVIDIRPVQDGLLTLTVEGVTAVVPGRPSGRR